MPERSRALYQHPLGVCPSVAEHFRSAGPACPRSEINPEGTAHRGPGNATRVDENVETNCNKVSIKATSLGRPSDYLGKPAFASSTYFMPRGANGRVS